MTSYPKTTKKKKKKKIFFLKFKLKATSCAEQLYIALQRWWAHKKKTTGQIKDNSCREDSPN